MRPLEILLLVVNAPAAAYWLCTRGLPSWALPASALALLLLVTHAVLDGCRLQMTPAYLATVGLFLTALWPRLPNFGPWPGAAFLLCLACAGVLGTMLPVFALPVPTGTFTIGLTTRHLIDQGREETHGGRRADRRELMIHLWFPSDQAGVSQYYRADLPATFKNAHLRLVRLNSCQGVPVASSPSRFPVLIFSPAWTGNCTQYTFLAEELASRGYIVAGLDHTYGSDPTAFPDGRVIPTVLDKWLDYSSDDALLESIRTAEAELRWRTADVRFTLDELERLDKKDPTGLLTGRIDVTRAGVFGHSFGGAVAAEVCRSDARFKAGINFDGLLFGKAAAEGVPTPFLFASDGTPWPTPSELAAATGPHRRRLAILDRDVQAIRRSLARYGGYQTTIRGASHTNFCDSSLYTPIKRITGAGSIDARRAMTIVTTYASAFFDKHLAAQDSGLLNGPSSQSPEVEIEVWPAPLDRSAAPP